MLRLLCLLLGGLVLLVKELHLLILSLCLLLSLLVLATIQLLSSLMLILLLQELITLPHSLPTIEIL